MTLKKTLCAATAALACCGARADSNFNLPEGSRDITVSATAFDTPRSEGGRKRQFGVLPSFTGRWSNGVFATLGQVGWDISDDPTLDWGPIVTYDLRQRRSDDPSDKVQVEFEGGAFAHYLFAWNLNFNTELLYGGGAERSGAKLVANATYAIRLGAHSSLTLSPGVEAVNASYMKSTFGVTPAQSAIDHLAPYQTHAGFKDVFFTVAGDWQVNNKWTVDAGVSTVRLVGSAAHSPLTEKRVDATFFLSGNYHF
ncbi:MAG: MipA/OmpV family protein [Vitreoscilla sp.]|jgi:outer membrane protein